MGPSATSEDCRCSFLNYSHIFASDYKHFSPEACAAISLTPNQSTYHSTESDLVAVVQMMFGRDVTVAVQDPSYPVYVDSSVIMGMTGGYNDSAKAFDNIEYMPCKPENGFFPDLSKARLLLNLSLLPNTDCFRSYLQDQYMPPPLYFPTQNYSRSCSQNQPFSHAAAPKA